jgi:hypothetical protein
MQGRERLFDRRFDAFVARPEHRRVAVSYQPVGEDHPARAHCRVGLELVSQVANQRSSRDDLRLPEPNLGLEKDPPGVFGRIQHVPERRGDLGSVARFEEPGASCHQLPALLGPLAGKQTFVEAARPDSRYKPFDQEAAQILAATPPGTRP